MGRLGLSLGAAALLALLGLGWGMDRLFEHYADPRRDAVAADELALGSRLALTLDAHAAAADFVARWNEQPIAPVIKLRLQDYAEFALPPELRTALEGGQALPLETAQGRSLNFLLPRTRQVLSLALPGEAAGGAGDDLRLALTLLFYAGVLTLLLLWLLPLLRRLARLRAAARAFGEGALERRIALSPTSYIADIEREFNRMAERIAVLVADNKLLGQAVSHDLRTPLARLRFGIEALAETRDPALQAKYQQRISDDVAAMEDLVEILLTYARLESALLTVARTPLQLDDLVAQCIAQADASRRRIDWHRPESPCRITGDARYLAMLVNNLLDNALRYSRSQLRIRIDLANCRACLHVEDDGPGIPPEQHAAMLQPFVRGEAGRQQPGHGMGLAIVARIAAWHGAEIRLDRSAALGGLAVRVCFAADGATGKAL